MSSASVLRRVSFPFFYPMSSSDIRSVSSTVNNSKRLIPYSGTGGLFTTSYLGTVNWPTSKTHWNRKPRWHNQTAMPSIFGFMARGPKKRVIARNEMSAGSPANAPPPRRDYLPARHIARGYDLAPTPFTPPERPRIVTLTHAIPTVPEPTAAQPSLPAPALPPSAPQPTSPPAANESQPDTPVPPPALNATTKPPPQPTAPPAAPPVPPAAAIMPANLATPAAAPPPLAPILAPAPTLAPPPSAGLTNSGVVPAARPFFDAAAESQPPITSITTSGVDHGSTIIVFVLIALGKLRTAAVLFHLL